MSSHDFVMGSIVLGPGMSLTSPAFTGAVVNRYRAERQRKASEWAAAAFNGGVTRSLRDSAMRLLEEALELAQAAGVTSDDAIAMRDHVYGKEAGEVRLELGQVGLTLLTVAESAGLDADTAEQWEVDHVLSKPLSHYTARYEAKKVAGVG